MDLFLVGLAAGFGIALIGFVIWNFNSPKGVDEAEEKIREKAPEFKEAVAKGRERLRRKLS